MTRLLVIALALAAGLRADDDGYRLHYLIPKTKEAKLSSRQRAEMLEAICDGKSDGTHCDTCPESSPVSSVGFSLDHVILGHFVAPDSEDAMVTIAGCEEMHASIGWGFLLTRRGGNWESIYDLLGLDLRRCHRMRFRSGRELLVCEDYRMDSFVLMHSVTAVFVKGESLSFRNLITASDTTRMCDSQERVQSAEIDKVEFGDNVIWFTASRGEMRDSDRRQELCQEAQTHRPAAAGPGPRVVKSYRIDYSFDGQRFKLTQASEAAAKLFRPLE